MKNNSVRALLAALVLHTALAAADNTPTIHDAWVREAPPGAQVLAGYAQIENATDQANAIIAVSSTAFEKAEIHRSEVKGGIARMAEIKRLDLPAQKIVKLEPGSTHLMLINPKSPLRAGDHVTLIFTLSSGNTLNVDAEVRNAMQPSEHHH